MIIRARLLFIPFFVLSMSSFYSSAQHRSSPVQNNFYSINYDLISGSTCKKPPFLSKPKSKSSSTQNYDDRWWGNQIDIEYLYNMGNNEPFPSAPISEFGTIKGAAFTLLGIGTKYTSKVLIEETIYLNRSITLQGSWVSGASLKMRKSKSNKHSALRTEDQTNLGSEFYRLKLSRKCLALSYHF